SNRRWMLYTWRVNRVDAMGNDTDAGYDGNNVAAYPMYNNRAMDALSPASDLIPIAYRFNSNNLIPKVTGDTCTGASPNPPAGYLHNGESSGAGTRMAGCNSNYAVAEGPSAYVYNNRTYVFYSRNGWNSPGYGIFYRFAPTNFPSMALSAWNDSAVSEYPLVM